MSSDPSYTQKALTPFLNDIQGSVGYVVVLYCNLFLCKCPDEYGMILRRDKCDGIQLETNWHDWDQPKVARAADNFKLLRMTSTPTVPTDAAAAILLRSAPVPDSAVAVQGPDFDHPHTLQSFLQSYERIGFQATSLGRAINVVNKMVRQ